MRYLFFFVGLMILVGYGLWRFEAALHWHLPEQDIRRPVLLEGRVSQLPVRAKVATRFTFLARAYDGIKLRHAIRLRLSWYGLAPPALKLGSDWRLVVKLKPIHPLQNPQTSLLTYWLARWRYRASGYVLVKDRRNHCLRSSAGLSRWRERIHAAIVATTLAPHTQALLQALALGDQQGLSDKDWQVLRKTGTSHLVAVSGLHIGLVAASGFFVGWSLWLAFVWLRLSLTRVTMAYFFALLFAALYAFLAGFAVPCQRALIMLFFWLLSLLIGLSWSHLMRLVFAVLVVYLWQPSALLMPGFWLSVMAVFWLGVSLYLQRPSMPFWQRWLVMQSVLVLGLLPWSLYYFQGVSWLTLPANLLAVPWVAMVVLPVILLALGLTLLGVEQVGMVWWLAGKLVHYLWQLLAWMSHCPYGYWQHGLSSLWMVLGLTVLIYFFWAMKGNHFRLWLLLAAQGFLFAVPTRPTEGEIFLTLLDVGQGLAVVVQTANHTLVYDLGAYLPGMLDRTQQVVLPFLYYQGIRSVDRLVISHTDNDHLGNLKRFIGAMHPWQIISSRSLTRWGVREDACAKLPDWQWDGVSFRFLYPVPDQPYRGNNSSCVLQIKVAGQVVLLTGDIERQAERWLLWHRRMAVHSTILQVPHHGSLSSSMRAWVKATHPQLALISAGYLNRFSLPKLAVVKRYQDMGAKVLNTAKVGAVQVVVSGSGWQLK